MTRERIQDLDHFLETDISTYGHILAGGDMNDKRLEWSSMELILAGGDMNGEHPGWCPMGHMDPHLYEESTSIGLKIRGLLASHNL